MSAVAALIHTYSDGAVELRRAIQGMSAAQATARPVPGKWSTLEVVCHMADFEPIYAARMKRIIALDKPLLLSADENLFTQHLHYQERDLEEEMHTIENTRKTMSRILKLLPEAAFQRTGVHSERGLLTLEQILASATNHIIHHTKFVFEKRKALGL